MRVRMRRSIQRTMDGFVFLKGREYEVDEQVARLWFRDGRACAAQAVKDGGDAELNKDLGDAPWNKDNRRPGRRRRGRKSIARAGSDSTNHARHSADE